MFCNGAPIIMLHSSSTGCSVLAKKAGVRAWRTGGMCAIAPAVRSDAERAADLFATPTSTASGLLGPRSSGCSASRSWLLICSCRTRRSIFVRASEKRHTSARRSPTVISSISCGTSSTMLSEMRSKCTSTLMLLLMDFAACRGIHRARISMRGRSSTDRLLRRTSSVSFCSAGGAAAGASVAVASA